MASHQICVSTPSLAPVFRSFSGLYCILSLVQSARWGFEINHDRLLLEVIDQVPILFPRFGFRSSPKSSGLYGEFFSKIPDPCGFCGGPFVLVSPWEGSELPLLILQDLIA